LPPAVAALAGGAFAQSSPVASGDHMASGAMASDHHAKGWKKNKTAHAAEGAVSSSAMSRGASKR
jgi:hypothetical protein